MPERQQLDRSIVEQGIEIDRTPVSRNGVSETTLQLQGMAKLKVGIGNTGIALQRSAVCVFRGAERAAFA
jgi:hypothetical protein